MKVLVIGSGGREHAICYAFNQNKQIAKIFCADGNAGIAEIAEPVSIKPTEIERLAAFAEANQIDLTFVGGETALALGVTDEFESRGLKIIGVSKQAAQLEASKAFAKDFMQRHSIPTAESETASSAGAAIEILRSGKFGDENSPVVVKADGLAAGKGVIVAKNRIEAEEGINELKTGEIVAREAADKIVLEECLFGREVSLLLFADGENFVLMPPVRDHKRIFENDEGANTGGMGTICDDSLLSPKEKDEIIEKIIKPTLEGARRDGFPIQGILFLGLMMTADGVKVLEYNVRFGDPETQSILYRLKTDFVEICQAIQDQTLDQINIEWRQGCSACVILAAENYPGPPKKGDFIQGLETIKQKENVMAFHSGTAKNESGEFITAGGRVLGITATGENLAEALGRAYEAVNQIAFDGMQYRRDIGK